MRYAAASWTRASHSAAEKRGGRMNAEAVGGIRHTAPSRIARLAASIACNRSGSNSAAADKVAILPRIADRGRRRQSNHDPLSGRRQCHPTPYVRARVAHRRARGRAAPEPAGVDPGQLPGARVRAPCLGAGAEQGGAAAAVEQIDKASWRVRCDAGPAARRPLPGLRVRHLGARGLPRQHARLLQRHRRVPARRRTGIDAARALARRPARRLGSGDDARAASRRQQRPRVQRRRLRHAGRPSGRARPLLAWPLRRCRRAA